MRQASYFPPTYAQDGFTHLTAEPALLMDVANHFYKQEPGEWIVLKLEAAKLTSEVRRRAGGAAFWLGLSARHILRRALAKPRLFSLHGAGEVRACSTGWGTPVARAHSQ